MERKFSVQKVGIVITLLLFFSAESFAQTLERRIEVGGFLTTIDLNDPVGEKPLGFGGRFAYNFKDNFAFDGEAAYFPENPSGNFGQTLALAGLRVGNDTINRGAGPIRPGTTHNLLASFGVGFRF